MGRLFGTDGVRGIANLDLSPELAFRLGRCGAYVLRRGYCRDGARPAILVGRDTRGSGDLLESAFLAGACSLGTDVLRVGVMTTPGIAYLTTCYDVMAGVVISASHNPAEYNGIKFFSRDGYKLSDEKESEIELECERISSGKQDWLPRPVGGEVGRARFLSDAAERYIRFLTGACPVRLDGLKVVLDCANGAASELAPEVFRRLGARVEVFNHQPDGLNINSSCGSTCPGALQARAKELEADVGFAFDGDADRAIAVDEKWNILDGDQIMAVCAIYLKGKGLLKKNAIAATVLSNVGLEVALARHGIKVIRTQVGDKYVIEQIRASGLSFGGEQSGHVVFADYATTGDGILTAVQVARIMVETGERLSTLAAVMRKYPQECRNVRVRTKEKLLENEKISSVVKSVRELLGSAGRVVVRPSGTEPVVRIMVEGEDESMVKSLAYEIEGVIRAELGERAGEP